MPQKRDSDSETIGYSDDQRADDAREDTADADTGSGPLIDRRTCLRLAGTAVASTAALGAAGTAAAETQINASEISGGTHTVPSGDYHKILVGGNQYGSYGDLEDCLIDATSGKLQIKCFGSWTIRNVGVEGPDETDGGVLNLDTDGGSGLVKNVYLSAGGKDQIGMFAKKEHNGTIKIEDCYVEGFSNNGIYASTFGKSGGGGGTVKIRNCYAKDNNRANIRVGGDGSSVEDCVVVATGDTPDTTGGKLNARGVWVRYGDVDLNNVDITTTETECIYATNGGTADYTNSDCETDYPRTFKGDVNESDVGSSPSTSPPSGVPTSASDAAGSGSSGRGGEDEADEDDTEDSEDTDAEEASSSSDLSNELIVSDSETKNGPTDYEITVSGEIETMSDPRGDSASGDTASGTVDEGEDGYLFSGEVTSFESEAEVDVELNGESVDL